MGESTFSRSSRFISRQKEKEEPAAKQRQSKQKRFGDICSSSSSFASATAASGTGGQVVVERIDDGDECPSLSLSRFPSTRARLSLCYQGISSSRAGREGGCYIIFIAPVTAVPISPPVFVHRLRISSHRPMLPLRLAVGQIEEVPRRLF